MEHLCYELGVMMYRASNGYVYNNTGYDVYENFKHIVSYLNEFNININEEEIKRGFFSENENDLLVDKKTAKILYDKLYKEIINENNL